MALSKSSLKDRIKNNIIAAYGAPDDSAQLEKMCQAIADAVVDEIKANAAVSVTGVQGGGATASGTVS